MTTNGSDEVHKTAHDAVVNLLQLKDFIDKQWDKIETRLLEAETRAEDTEKQVAKAHKRTAEAHERAAEANTVEAADAEVVAVTAEADANSAARSANIVFFAECLPYASAIVHTGSALSDFAKARLWALQRQPNPDNPVDPVSVLAVLTFFYLVDEGIKKSTGEDEKLKRWQSIRRRVNTLLGRLEETDNQQPTP